jgi:hypothetical protein
MDFRKELAKELGLGTIAENTMLDDYVKACEAIAVRYHESEVKKFRLGAVSGSYRYDIFYDIHGDMATATVRGKNVEDAKRVFKKIYGGWKITNVQRLK